MPTLDELLVNKHPVKGLAMDQIRELMVELMVLSDAELVDVHRSVITIIAQRRNDLSLEGFVKVCDLTRESVNVENS